jgi:hypothetical protein
MKIREVTANGRRRAFEVRTSERTYIFPFAQSKPVPSGADPVESVAPDPDFGNEAFTYRLRSGRHGSIHLDSVLEANRDPQYMADLLMYKLTLEAQRRIANADLPARNISRSLNTSPAQLYRLLDPTNYTKSFRQLVALLNLLGCDVDVTMTAPARTSRRRAGPEARSRNAKHQSARKRASV